MVGSTLLVVVMVVVVVVVVVVMVMVDQNLSLCLFHLRTYTKWAVSQKIEQRN